MQTFSIKYRAPTTVSLVSNHLLNLCTLYNPEATMTIRFSDSTIELTNIGMEYDEMIDRLHNIQPLVMVKNYYDGYYAAPLQAKSNYLARKEIIELAEDEVSFEHAAKEAGYDKDLYPDGRDFEDDKPGLGGTTFKIKFNKEWLKPNDDDKDFMDEVNDILKS